MPDVWAHCLAQRQPSEIRSGCVSLTGGSVRFTQRQREAPPVLFMRRFREETFVKQLCWKQ